MGFACCCAFHAHIARSVGQEQRAPFVCITFEPPNLGGDIVEYSAQAGISLALARDNLFARGITEYGVGALANVWRRGDGIGVGNKILLGIHFVDGDDSEKQLVRDNASAWLQGGA